MRDAALLGARLLLGTAKMITAKPAPAEPVAAGA
jgi:hypothetical protein